MIDVFTIGALCTLMAFFGTYVLTRKWISVAKNIKLVGKDMNKYEKPLVSEGGGVAVALTIIVSILFYIFFKTFLIGNETNLIEIFAVLVTVIIAGFVGFLDDMLGWLKGLRQKTKVLLTLAIALPLVVINAGQSTMALPLIGLVNFGIFYPLLIVPLAIICATNGYNMLAGYNGLEASMGVIIISTLSYVSFLNGYFWLTMIGLIAVSSLLAFLVFNWYPSKIFPGDSLTYTLGALIAAMAILGNMQTIGLILFIPYMCDFILTSRTKMQAEAFAKVNKDNSLELPYDKFYDSTHVAIAVLKKIKRKVYEKDVVICILGLEALLALVCVFLI
jgi:UDP-N-acetylglucosamine--dolichyl-phosphate N-acetylglucosaminephosphotransferase